MKTNKVKKRIHITYLFILIGVFKGYTQKNVLSGFVVDSMSREPLIGVSIRSSLQGVQSNEYGYFSIFINATDTLFLSSVGYKADTLYLRKGDQLSQQVQLSLIQSDLELSTVVVKANRDRNTGGSIYLKPGDIKKLPIILGEKDPIKALLYLPGVQAGVEGTNSFFVRGGNAGENLLLLDEATVYNANHLFGFFSVFNIDAIKGMRFYKGNFPAQFGGRSSSVIDIHSKEGNMTSWHGSGGISLISSRLTLEGPIIKEKLSMSLSGRRTYLDAIMRPLQKNNPDKYLYGFYDLNGKLKWKLSPSSTMLFNAYGGKDDLSNRFRRNIAVDGIRGVRDENSFLRWGNQTYSLRFNQLFGKNIFSNTSLIYSSYFGQNTAERITQGGTYRTLNLRSVDSGLSEKTIKTDLFWSRNIKDEVNVGVWLSDYVFNPKIERSVDTEKGTEQTSKLSYRGTDWGVYAEEKHKFGTRTSSRIGLRTHALFTPNKSYFMLEPRISFSYSIGNKDLITADYSRMNQFINQIQSTNLGLSTDLWFIATDKIPPAISDIYSLSYKTEIKNQWEFTVETYFRQMRKVSHLSADKSFFLVSEEINIDDDIADYISIGEGIAGGVEFMVEKEVGRLNGFSSLTLSRVIYRVDGENRNKPFLPFQDRPISFNTVVNYQLKKNIGLSGSWVYYSAPLLKSPEAYSVFVLPNINFHLTEPYMILGNINKSRGKDYHRLDITLTFEKKKKRFSRVLEVGVYNLYFRKNPIFYSIQSTSSPDTGQSLLKLKEVSLLPIIPFVSYNFTF